MPRASIIIPTWNGRPLLVACLDALRAQTETDFEIVVVDNGSGDGTVSWLGQRHPDVRIVANPTNAGFARAVNQGICATHAEFVVVLNNDTEPEPQWLAELLHAAHDTPQTGMVASKMLFADRPDVVNSAGICLDVTGIAWDRLGGAPDDPRESESQEIFGPCGGAALYRRSMLDQIGLFDESFFAYLEDVDLAWRARAAGWACVYAPQARVLHRHSATSVEGSPFKRYQLGRKMVWLIAKNYPFRELWWGGPLVVLYDVAAVVYALLARHDVHALRGRIAGLTGLGPRLRQREYHKERPDIASMSPLAPPWSVSARYSHLEKKK
jgi:GT2 family glycosyltransferase